LIGQATQAAARTFPHVFPDFSVNFKCVRHCLGSFDNSTDSPATSDSMDLNNAVPAGIG
jgi:hypothetical protein